MTTFEGPPLDSLEGIGALTMGAFLEEVGARFADHEALVFDDPLRDGATVRWTYADLLAEARRVGRGLRDLGVEPGARVGILMGNRPEAVASLFGAAFAGAVAVPLSTFAPKPELAHMLGVAEVSVVLTQERLLARRFLEDVAELQPDLPHLRATHDVLEMLRAQDRHGASQERGVGVEEQSARVVGTAGVVGSAGVAGVVGSAGVAGVATPDDDALVIFSSGTTSAPKGILHSHRAATLQFWVQAQIFGRHDQTRMWSALPLFWTAGLNTAMGATLAAGGCWVMQETFEPGGALRLMSRERVTEPYPLPHQTGALEEHPDWATTDLSSLTCVYGKSALARHPSVHGDPSWRMPVGYGLSETCAFFCAHWWDVPRDVAARSMGRLLPGNELRVVDPDTGRALGVGETGELAVKGPTLMRGYLGRRPEDCFDRDGFFRTGDAGSVDADGFVHWEGRWTEMIKTGGANVSPAELEVQLRACAPVKLARIVGVPDPRAGEVVVACITLQDGADATEADIQGFLRERVASYKVPKRVLFFADGEIPMTTGDTKVRDDDLVALAVARLADADVHRDVDADRPQPVPLTRGDR